MRGWRQDFTNRVATTHKALCCLGHAWAPPCQGRAAAALQGLFCSGEAARTPVASGPHERFTAAKQRREFVADNERGVETIVRIDEDTKMMLSNRGAAVERSSAEGHYVCGRGLAFAVPDDAVRPSI